VTRKQSKRINIKRDKIEKESIDEEREKSEKMKAKRLFCALKESYSQSNTCTAIYLVLYV